MGSYTVANVPPIIISLGDSETDSECEFFEEAT